MTRLPFLLAALLVPVALSAADDTPLSPADFAYSRSIEVAADVPVHAVVLTPQVYRALTRADQADLRVFNGAGSEVPHALRSQGPGDAVAPPEQPVPVYPLYATPDEPSGELSLRVERSADGQVLSLSQGIEPPARGERVLEGLVADMSQLGAPVTGLRFELGEGDESFATPVRIETSHDLGTWQPLGGIGRKPASSPPENRDGNCAVSRPAVSNFPRGQGNQGLARRRTSVRRTSEPAD